MKKWIKLNLAAILMLISALACFLGTNALIAWASANPLFVENYYSNIIFVALKGIPTEVIDSFPFSVAELIIAAIIAASLALIIALLVLLFKKCWRVIVLLLSSVALFSSVLYMQMYITWGFNYYRMPLSYSIDLPQSPRSDEQLFKLCVTLAAKANELRASLCENPDGTANLGEIDEILTMPVEAFKNLSKTFPIDGNVKRSKKVLMSEAMSYANISGIYIPYTREANVNIKQPALLLPVTACHEAVHQLGFAREDEANFLAFLACWYSPDIRMQYSGTMHALISAQNAFIKVNKAQAYSVMQQYSDGVQRDFDAHNKFWANYKGQVAKSVDKLNDNYLKANGQAAGVSSYGMMLNLILDWYYEFLPYC